MNGTANGLVTGNYFDKYRSPNPLHARLVGGFVTAARKLISSAAPVSVIEIGCGPGDLAARLFEPESTPPVRYLGTDVSEEQVETARNRYPHLAFQSASAYALPVPDKSYDLGIACEVLEHLDEPHAALGELARVVSGHVLISVPWEPVWRVLNCARGKYLSSLGNTPGHIQHFSRRRIRKVVGASFRIVDERRPFPWTMLLAKVIN